MGRCVCMDIFNIHFENYYYLVITINWVILLGILVVVLGIIKTSWFNFFSNQIVVDEANLGIGQNTIKLKFNRKDQEIAYKLWVELNTRKIGLEIEKDHDVIVEIYNSWYSFFGIARELLKEMPCEKLEYSETLVVLTIEVLNIGLRPHLTQWQAKFRKWYDIECKNNEKLSPQEIQKQYPEYDLLLSDLIKTNEKMIYYRNLMKEIAFKS